MAIAEHLKALQDEFIDCQIAAYVDLSAKMVLSSSTQLAVPQEKLDLLCQKAAAILANEDAATFLSGDAAEPLQSAIIVLGDSVNVFHRSPADPDEALCCVCAVGVDIETFLSSAQNGVAAIGAEI